MMIVNQILESADLRAQVLEQELDQWLKLTKEGEALERNHSQLGLIHEAFKKILENLQEKRKFLNANAVGINNQKFVEVAAIDSIVHQAFELWGIYRTWFAQRFVDPFRDYLRATDGIAHDCYRAVVDRLDALRIDRNNLRSYPITAFDGRYESPYTMTRGVRLRPTLLQSLPVPMVAVPWNMQTMVWNCLAIHHEVGHDLDKDLGNPSSEIAEHLRQKLVAKRTVEMRVQAWQRWSKEIVADYFGVILGGPAFLGFMATYLARHPHEVLDFREDAVHPVPYLRILLVAKFVDSVWGNKCQGVIDYTSSVEKDWKSIYTKIPSHISNFCEDFDLVVDTLANLPLNCLRDDQSMRHTLAELCPPEAGLFDRQIEAAKRLRGDLRFDIELRSPRLIPGAAQFAFESDPRNTELNANAIAAIIEAVPRGQLGDDDEQQKRTIDRFVSNFFSDFDEIGS